MARSDYDVVEIAVGDGSTVNFPYTFKIESLAQLLVVVYDTDGEETMRVRGTEAVLLNPAGMTFDAVNGGGNVRFTTAPTTGYDIRILLANDEPTQTYEFKNKADFTLSRLENALDFLSGQIQRLAYLARRTIYLRPLDDSADFDMELPTPQAGHLIGWNGDATAITSYDQTGITALVPTLTTKGDIFVRNATVVTRLPVGLDGRFLRANSAAAEGIDWAAPGGGGGALQWVEDALAPISAVENNAQVYLYQSGLTQYLYCDVRVPTSYNAGTQISLKLTYYTSDSSNTVLLTSLATLVRTGTDAITSTTNQRTSTNVAVTLSGAANLLRTVTLDLTSSTGTINSVAVSAGDLIRVRLTRGTDTATADVRVLPYGVEPVFA